VPTELLRSAGRREETDEPTAIAPRTFKVRDALPRLMWTAGEAATACGFSLRTWWRLDSAGKIPAAVQFGRSKRWSAETLRAWVEAGCPDRKRWESLQSGR
jgi:predicted DNA-binding transcriptional regulator AlpA